MPLVLYPISLSLSRFCQCEQAISRTQCNLTRVDSSIFSNYVLDISEGIHDLGPVRWQLALCLLAAWVLVCLCLIKGIKSQGKVSIVRYTDVSLMVYSHCLSPGQRNRDQKNGLYDIMQIVSHYTATGTPLFSMVLVPIPVPVPE